MIEQLKTRFRNFEKELNGDGNSLWHELRTDAFNRFTEKGFPL
jgi:hypothetical protein